MKVCFLVNDLQLSGGVGVVVEHARRLAHDHGFDTALVLVREQETPSWRYEALAERTRALADRHEEPPPVPASSNGHGNLEMAVGATES